MKSKGYKSGGAISDSERKSMEKSMERKTNKAFSRQSVSDAIKTLRSFGGAMTNSERKTLENLLDKPTKKSMGGSMKTKGYSNGGSYQGQKQRYKQTGEV